MSDAEVKNAKDSYSDAVSEIAELCDETFGDGSDMDELADDVMYQFIRDAGEVCGLAGIDREKRPAVIAAGLERYMMQDVEQNVQDFKWQLEIMYSL